MDAATIAHLTNRARMPQYAWRVAGMGIFIAAASDRDIVIRSAAPCPLPLGPIWESPTCQRLLSRMSVRRTVASSLSFAWLTLG